VILFAAGTLPGERGLKLHRGLQIAESTCRSSGMGENNRPLSLEHMKKRFLTEKEHVRADTGTERKGERPNREKEK